MAVHTLSLTHVLLWYDSLCRKKRRSSMAQAGETMEEPEICIDGSDYDEDFDDAVSDA